MDTYPIFNIEFAALEGYKAIKTGMRVDLNLTNKKNK